MILLQPTEQTRSRRKAEVVNELLWVAGPKERSPALAPGPLVSTVGFLTCLTITTFTDGRHGRDAGALCGGAEAGSAADGV